MHDHKLSQIATVATPPPPRRLQQHRSTCLKSLRTALHPMQMDLSNRLRADEGIHTAAVFLCDDDVLLR